MIGFVRDGAVFVFVVVLPVVHSGGSARAVRSSAAGAPPPPTASASPFWPRVCDDLNVIRL